MLGDCVLSKGWYALQTRPRQEELSCSILMAKGYEVFLPTVVSRRMKKGRCEKCDKPLFPGYLFCRFVTGLIGKIVTTPGVTRIVACGCTAARISDEEIRCIQRLNDSDVTKQPWKYLPVGCRVRIQTGPLAGISGVLISGADQFRLIVSVTLLQRSVAVVLNNDVVLVPTLDQCEATYGTYSESEKLALNLAKISCHP